MPKNIIVCYDGTSNEYGDNNTNVVGLFERVLKEQDQVAFYDPGVGTFSFLGRYLGRKVGILLGKAFGVGLIENIEDGYEYLMNRYLPGDQLFIFGFSRGAYTARALAGMLNKCGLLQKGSKNLVPYATKIYFTRGNAKTAAGFKATYCNECKPHFVGVWDTVGSFGHFFGKTFSNLDLNPDVRYGFQAVAIDEKRKKFPVSLWNEKNPTKRQTIVQVWFPGVHSDVGGWYQERGLSDGALEWLLGAAEKQGLKLRKDWRKTIHPDPLDVLHESRTGFWKLWKPVTRQIPEHALVHKSAVVRMKKRQDYKPKLPKKHKVIT